MDGGAARRIASLCSLAPGERAIEVGAGTGTLTRALADSNARLTALEIDPELVEILRARSDLPGVEIELADALDYDYAAATKTQPWVATGNLPYNIATPLVMNWIEGPNPPRRIVVMVQRDVAARFTAKPGSAAYGSLSVAVQFATLPTAEFTLRPDAFYPRPKVDSSVVVLEHRAEPAVAVRDRGFFRQVVRGAFAYRRKTLANSLALALRIERKDVAAALNGLGIDTEIRGEQLDLAAFAAIADALTS
jgi:16S rRNA (adenine1518-N6/adenine1519-N6)-dimethyltransferase